jgi:hypothetical protein
MNSGYGAVQCPAGSSFERLVKFPFRQRLEAFLVRSYAKSGTRSLEDHLARGQGPAGLSTFD